MQSTTDGGSSDRDVIDEIVAPLTCVPSAQETTVTGHTN